MVLCDIKSFVCADVLFSTVCIRRLHVRDFCLMFYALHLCVVCASPFASVIVSQIRHAVRIRSISRIPHQHFCVFCVLLSGA